MEQKHNMLYPPIETDANPTSAQRQQRISASAAIGLPIEAPPSYDYTMNNDLSRSPSVVGHNMRASVAMMAYDNPEHQQSQHYHQNEPTHTVVRNNRVSMIVPRLGPHPCTVPCPTCMENRLTRVNYTPNTRTHICAFLLCLVGWCCCACWVPYCLNSCRTSNHYCQDCNTFIGSYIPHENK